MPPSAPVPPGKPAMPSSGLAAAGFPEVLDFLWACKGVVVFRVPGFRVCSLGPVDLRHVQGASGGSSARCRERRGDGIHFLNP